MRNIIIGTATIAVAVEFAATAAQTADTGAISAKGARQPTSEHPATTTSTAALAARGRATTARTKVGA